MTTTAESALNPHLDALARYDDLIAAASARYGADGQGVAYVLYEKLIFLRRCLDADPSLLVLRARAAEVTDLLQLYYRLGDDPASEHPTRLVGEDPAVVEFDRAAFERYGYAKAAESIAGSLATLCATRDPRIKQGELYLYVLDDEGNFVIWPRPFRYAELAFGIDRARIGNVPVAHPMLVPQRLRAVAAGEVVVIGDVQTSAVIANTRSGHFRPPPSCETAIRKRLSEVLALDDRDIDVIVVT